jgi:hypothetical protein
MVLRRSRSASSRYTRTPIAIVVTEHPAGQEVACVTSSTGPVPKLSPLIADDILTLRKSCEALRSLGSVPEFPGWAGPPTSLGVT